MKYAIGQEVHVVVPTYEAGWRGHYRDGYTAVSGHVVSCDDGAVCIWVDDMPEQCRRSRMLFVELDEAPSRIFDDWETACDRACDLTRPK